MTEEEILKVCKDLIEMKDYKFQCNYTTKERNQAIQGLLDLYNKQKEEIEELKQSNEAFKRYTVNCRELEIEINNAWEDKVRKSIKELEEMQVGGTAFETAKNFAIRNLKELLEE